MDLKIATFNILNPYHAVKWGEKVGLNELGRAQDPEELKAEAKKGNWRPYTNWNTRKKRIAEALLLADIAMVQEIAEETLADLEALGVTFASVAYHREGGGGETHGNAIAYNPSKVRLIDSGSIAYDTRKAATAQFACGNLVLSTASVHLKGYPPRKDYTGPIALVKEDGYLEVAAYADAIQSKDVTIIAGDFNEDWKDVADPCRKRYLEQKGYVTTTSKSPTELSTGRKIDWIYLKSDRKLDISDLSYENEQEPISDHFMTGILIHGI